MLSVTGSLASLNPLRYRGYYYDAETGLYYLRSRYYDPEIGRFINADTFASTGQGILGCNMFAYCGNDPVGNTDPEGQWMYTNVDNDDSGMHPGIVDAWIRRILAEREIAKANRFIYSMLSPVNGVGASGAIGLGVAISGDVSVVCDKHEHAGIAITVGAGGGLGCSVK